jgi:excisionase family DNA binding protein
MSIIMAVSMQLTLSPKEVAQALGVSESSLKRWVDEGKVRAQRTSGGHRRIALNDAIQFARQTQLPVLRPDLLGLPAAQTESFDGPVKDSASTLFDLLIAGQDVSARSLLVGLYLSGRSMAQICDECFAPALKRIGELWQHDSRGIYLEHRALDISMRAVAQLQTLLPTADANAPVAIGAAPAGDPYILPTAMAAMVLISEGYQAINLGPNTPMESYWLACQEHRPMLAWLSISCTTPQLDQYLRQLVPQLKSLNIPLILGGRSHESHCPAPAHSPHVHSAHSMSELAAFACGRKAAI